MDYIEHKTKMFDALNTPVCPPEEREVLDPDITEDRLEMLYMQMADIILWLSTPSLPSIGSLT